MGARAILVAWVLAAQVVAPSLALAATARSSCCCATDGSKKCYCPACAKVRAIEEGHGLVGSCAGSPGRAIAASTMFAAPPAAAAPAAVFGAKCAVLPRVASPPLPIQEVPTPPPLA